MKYQNATVLLPQHLIEEIQHYIEGAYLYIPTCSEKKAWGEKSGGRQFLQKRNQEIYEQFLQGKSVVKLASQYYLSESSIRHIIRTLQRKET